MATNNEINTGEQYPAHVAVTCSQCEAVGYEPCRTKRGLVMSDWHKERREDNARNVLAANARSGGVLARRRVKRGNE